MKTIILLFGPSCAAIIVILLLNVIFKIFLDLWNKVFGTHTIILADFDETIYEKRRNWDDKLVSSYCSPNLSFILDKDFIYITEKEAQDE